LEESVALFDRSKTDPSFPPKQLAKMSSDNTKKEKATQDALKQYETCVADFQKFQEISVFQMKALFLRILPFV
jgi:hypothetical protein